MLTQRGMINDEVDLHSQIISWYTGLRRVPLQNLHTIKVYITHSFYLNRPGKEVGIFILFSIYCFFSKKTISIFLCDN